MYIFVQVCGTVKKKSKNAPPVPPVKMLTNIQQMGKLYA